MGTARAPIQQTPAVATEGSAPLNFFYKNLHDAIRSELDSLAQSVLKLEVIPAGVDSQISELSHLRDRYRFLEQVYKYHSSVEDEVSPHPPNTKQIPLNSQFHLFPTPLQTLPNLFFYGCTF